MRAGGNAIALEECEGTVAGNRIANAANNAIFSIDSRGLIVTGNVIRDSGNGGIRVWHSEKRRDGSLIADNRIDNTAARSGGSGQNGNAINVFRAGNVIVRNNVIRAAAFTAVRAAAASDVQILGNNCAHLDEVAIYCEFEFVNAVIADNVIDEAGSGISVTNFKEGGRLAAVRGNVVSNCRARIPGTAPDTQGYRHFRRGRHRRHRQHRQQHRHGRHIPRLGRIHARRDGHRQCGACLRHRRGSVRRQRRG